MAETWVHRARLFVVSEQRGQLFLVGLGTSWMGGGIYVGLGASRVEAEILVGLGASRAEIVFFRWRELRWIREGPQRVR